MILRALPKLLVLGALACNREPRRESAEAPEASASPGKCEVRVGDKLGFAFASLCTEDERRRPAGSPAHFVSLAPLGCTAGEHETVGCPSITSLSSIRATPIAPQPAALVTAVVAHRICNLRFGGRLPTRDELAWASRELGLATLLVSQLEPPAEGFRFDPLREWSADSACRTPALLGPECAVGVHPPAAEQLPIPWPRLVACVARPRDAATPGERVLIGTACAAPSFEWSAQADSSSVLPCLARSTGGRAYELACKKPTGAAAHPSDGEEKVAAFRCVVPETALSDVHPVAGH